MREIYIILEMRNEYIKVNINIFMRKSCMSFYIDIYSIPKELFFKNMSRHEIEINRQ